MMWIMFLIGLLTGGMVGSFVMALMVGASMGDEDSRIVDAYWDGRHQGRRVTESLLQVDREPPAVKD